MGVDAVFKIKRRLFAMKGACVASDVNMAGNMVLTGNFTQTGDMTITGTLRPSALDASSLDLEFDDITLSGSLGVACAFSASSASITGSASVGSVLSTAVFSASGASITHSASVACLVNACGVHMGHASVTYSASVASIVNACMLAGGQASITHSASIASNLALTGSAVIAGDVAITKAVSGSVVTVTDSASVGCMVSGLHGHFGAASITNSASIASNLALTGSAVIGGDVAITGAQDVVGTLRVASAAAEGTKIFEMLSGSLTVATPPFTGDTPASVACTADIALVTISASHSLVVTNGDVEATSGCIVLAGACPGDGVVTVFFAYTAGSGGGAVAAGSTTVRYMAFRT